MRLEISHTLSPFKDCKKIYVYCPGGSVTGGPELLHQLVSELVKNNVPASIVYYPCNRVWTTPEPYLRYECPVEREAPDNSDIAVIVPEVATDLLHHFSSALRCIWWLSVDNYRGNFENRHQAKQFIKRCFVSELKSPKETIHLCQSLYSQTFIQRRFGVVGHFLSDYLADEFLDISSPISRNDIVIYNPKKGVSTTSSIIRNGPGIRFSPIVNMTRDQVRETLRSAKVYIDFGYHPGKDRIPREAASCGCVVIVGKRGSAKNDDDVSIPSDYKFEPWQGKQVVAQIRRVLADYPSHYYAQEPYRLRIRSEKSEFAARVRTLFGCISAELP
jgi:hypothetical protein